MEPGIEMWSNYGLAGAVIAVLVVQVRYLQTKLVSVIENNTKALIELKVLIESNDK